MSTLGRAGTRMGCSAPHLPCCEETGYRRALLHLRRVLRRPSAIMACHKTGTRAFEARSSAGGHYGLNRIRMALIARSCIIGLLATVDSCEKHLK